MKNFYIILPNIRSCHNVGAMFRTADAFAVTKLFLVGYTAQPPKIQIDKVALGAEKWMDWEHHEDLSSLIGELKEQDVRILALEKSETSVPMSSLEIDESIALIVGNEVEGIDEPILALCDDITHIPMLGKKESLNVSIAAGIAMHTLRQKLDA